MKKRAAPQIMFGGALGSSFVGIGQLAIGAPIAFWFLALAVILTALGGLMFSAR